VVSSNGLHVAWRRRAFRLFPIRQNVEVVLTDADPRHIRVGSIPRMSRAACIRVSSEGPPAPYQRGFQFLHLATVRQSKARENQGAL
jgi:hypothetical protein